MTCNGCGYTFSPFVGFFAAKGKRYSRELVASLVLSALTVSYHKTSKRAGREINRRTEIGNIGTIICAEGSFPEAARGLALNGAEIIWRATYPEPWMGNRMFEIQNRSHAIFNTCYVIGPNIADLWIQEHKISFGTSHIIDFRGNIISQYLGIYFTSTELFAPDSSSGNRLASYEAGVFLALPIQPRPAPYRRYRRQALPHNLAPCIITLLP